MKRIIFIILLIFIIVGNLEIVFAANSSIDSEFKKLIMDTENKKLNSELRREKTEILMKKLEKYLQTKESSLKSDEELIKLMKSKIEILNRNTTDGRKVRVINYQGEFGIFGTIEGKWIIIQIYNNEMVTAKMIFENSCETAVGIISEHLKNTEYFIIYGYSAIYRPMPVFFNSFTIENGKYKNYDVFEKNKPAGNLNIEKSDNYILLTGEDEEGLNIEDMKNEDLIVIRDGDKAYKFFINNGKMILKK